MTDFIKRSCLVAAFAASAGLAGCATNPYVPTLYDAASADVSSIAIADDALPDSIGANELASAMGTGQATGGLIGALVVAGLEGAETASRKRAIAELLEPHDFDPEKEFEVALASKLGEAGFTGLGIIEVERKGRKPLEGLPESTSDAVLDIAATSFGMQKAVTGEEWRPAAGMTVRLLRTGTEDVLMENVISYNNGVVSEVNREGIIEIAPDTNSVGYMKIKEMDAEVVIEEMRAMIDILSDAVVSLLTDA